MTKPILLLDFDGVIHDYKEGWQDGKIYGELTPGFVEWMIKAKRHFRLCVYSSRSAEGHKGIKPIQDWLSVNLWAYHIDHPNIDPQDLTINSFEFPTQKPPAFITIDDRCVCFTGDWTKEELQPEKLRAFKSWTQLKGTEDENGVQNQIGRDQAKA